ncbi:Gfo/Idh/MocA family oxidoreductase [Neobacillus sp. FSL H8-0543]|uniref:Gfo/Idh/MocA family protein n=1 Tax=Neobacillus sp. FSL H8-0543 TaxID=2954672 RepID=UPI0031583728
MGNVKVGVIGIGYMGRTYALQLDTGLVEGAVLTAVCGRIQQLEDIKMQVKGNVQCYQDEDVFLQESGIDAVIIATPHFSHPEIAKKAFAKGIHVLVEKPAGVYSKHVIEMNESARKSGKVFAVMLNQRINPLYQKLRELIQKGELGEIKRTNWIITDWYRPQSYYDLSSWRATWKGEGGGVLLNQAPHQLDLWQWITGLRLKRVHAFCHYGKYHDIEVEDDVTAYVEYENGATGVFIASTGEAPGTNRFEIVGDYGKLVVENNALTFFKLAQSEREFNATFKGGFGMPEYQRIDIPVDSGNPGHLGLIQNWVNGILHRTPLLAPGEDGLQSVDIANAIYLSSWMNQTVEFPVDADLYYEKLQEKIKQSTLNLSK